MTLPNLTIVAVVVLAFVWVLLEQTTFGRRLYAIGGNIEAAYLSGVPVRRLRLPPSRSPASAPQAPACSMPAASPPPTRRRARA